MRPLLNTQVWHREQEGHSSQQEERRVEPQQGSGIAQQAWGIPTASTSQPLSQACGADREHEQGCYHFSGCEHAHPTENASVSCPSCPLAILTQRRNENLCQWVEWFCSWDCLTPDSPRYKPPCSSTARLMWRNMKEVFSNIQCILSILATNFLPKGFYLFSQKNESLVLFLNLPMLQFFIKGIYFCLFFLGSNFFFFFLNWCYYHLYSCTTGNPQLETRDLVTKKMFLF